MCTRIDNDMIHFENRDCMDGMREFPDKFFDLAIVDPPYGGAADKHETNLKNISGGGVLTGADRAGGSETGGLHATISATRTGGRWAKRYQRERQGRQISEIGISRRQKNTLKNSDVFRKIRSFGAATISIYRRRVAFLYGAKRIFRRKVSAWRL